MIAVDTIMDNPEITGHRALQQCGHVVQIAVVQRWHHGLELVMGAADVDDDTVAVERLGDESGVDDKGRAVQRLSRPKHGAFERMSDHDVIANFNCEQETSLRIGNGLA